MKIAFVAQDLVGQGVQYATAAVIREFCRRGYDVDLLLSEYHWDYLALGQKAFEVPGAVKVIRMPHRSCKKNVFFLRRYLDSGGADFIIAESEMYAKCLRIASIGFRKTKMPKLSFVGHGTYQLLPEPLWPRFKMWLKLLLRYSKFHAAFMVNEQGRLNFLKDTSALDPSHVIVVHNPVVDEVFFRKVSHDPTHPWLREKECPTFVTAGSFDANKGHLMLIKAIAQVSKTNAVRLIIYGRGNLEGDYRAYIAEHALEDVVSIGGFTDNLPAELKAADCFLLGSREESFGIVIVEALAAGTPVISTDAYAGPREVLDNGKYGVLVPVGNVDEMAKAIRNFLRSPRPEIPKEAWLRYTNEKSVDLYERGLK